MSNNQKLKEVKFLIKQTVKLIVGDFKSEKIKQLNKAKEDKCNGKFKKQLLI